MLKEPSVPFRAMILAAGRGERMRPLTDTLPKPLLKVDGKALIEYHLDNLAAAGFADIVINHAYLGEIIERVLGSGKRYGVNIHYSQEPQVLETAGGIAKALPLLTDQSYNQPFLVVNADIYCEMNYASLLPVLKQMFLSADSKQAHLVLVDNPAHHPDGDFALDGTKVLLTGENKLTFSGIGIYQPKFFGYIKKNVAMMLAPLLRQAIDKKRVSAAHYDGVWIDVGTPERLELLDRRLSQN